MRYIVLVSAFLFFLIIPYTSYADPEDKVRFYVGAKLGYHGLIPSRIHDYSYTIAPYHSPYTLQTGVLSVFTIGGSGGIHIPINSKFRSRTEIEYLYHFEGKTKKLNDGMNQFSRMKIASHTLLINSYIDYDIIKFVALYLGVGIGSSFLEVDIEKERRSVMHKSFKVIPNFAWQVGLGSRIELTEYIFLDANLRYLSLGGINAFGDVTTVRMGMKNNSAIELLFSASYVF